MALLGDREHELFGLGAAGGGCGYRAPAPRDADQRRRDRPGLDRYLSGDIGLRYAGGGQKRSVGNNGTVNLAKEMGRFGS